MRKNILKMTVAAVVLAAGGYGIYQNQIQTKAMSALELANVEALAQDEIPVNLPCEEQLGSECNFTVTYTKDGEIVTSTGTIQNMKYKG